MDIELLESIGSWAGYIALALFVIFKNSAQRYVDKKAENLASLEDTAKITQEVESVKSGHIRQSHAWKWIFEKEYAVLEQVWRASWEVQSSARAVCPSFDYISPDPDEAKKEYIARADKYSIAATSYLNAVTKQRPFIPPAIYEICELVEKSVIRLKIEFQKTFRGRADRIEWEEIEKQEAELDRLMSELNKCIRKHIHEVPNKSTHSITGSAGSE